jgi:hypothetical protein
MKSELFIGMFDDMILGATDDTSSTDDTSTSGGFSFYNFL